MSAEECPQTPPEGWVKVKDGMIQIGDWRGPNNSFGADFADHGAAERDVKGSSFEIYRKPKQVKCEPSALDGFYDKCKAAGFDPDAAQSLSDQAQELNMGYEKALTFDDGKPPLANLPWAAIRELSMVQLYGAKKYNDYNNYRKGMELSRNLSCALRHISEYCDGRDNDPESGRSHLGHALCRIAFVLQNLADGTAIDDRFKPKSDTKSEAPAAPR